MQNHEQTAKEGGPERALRHRDLSEFADYSLPPSRPAASALKT
jgi:hypothetical protein